MKFEEALVELRKGKSIKNSDFGEVFSLNLKNLNSCIICGETIINDRWEILEEPGKTFYQVLEAFKEGKKIRRKIWDDGFISKESSYFISSEDVRSNDWEIID